MRKERQNLCAAVLIAASCTAFGCRRDAAATVNQAQQTTTEKTAAEPADSYEKDGISFVLRKNWKVAEDENMGSGVRYLSIEDDKNAVVTLTFIPTGSKPDLKKYAADFIQTIRSSSGGTLTENGETEITRNAANVEKKGIARKYTLTTAGESVPHRAELFLIDGRKYDCVVVYNAPDDEKTAADAGFETILYTASMKSKP